MATVAEGTGGKLRRKLTRRTPTPYDRPPASNRAARGVGIETSLSLEGERRRGWISKLVDPASAILTKGATRLFSSVFRKRLGAPPAAENLGNIYFFTPANCLFFLLLFLFSVILNLAVIGGRFWFAFSLIFCVRVVTFSIPCELRLYNQTCLFLVANSCNY